MFDQSWIYMSLTNSHTGIHQQQSERGALQYQHFMTLTKHTVIFLKSSLLPKLTLRKHSVNN